MSVNVTVMHVFKDIAVIRLAMGAVRTFLLVIMSDSVVRVCVCV